MTLLLSLFGHYVWLKEICMGARLIWDGLVVVNCVCQLC